MIIKTAALNVIPLTPGLISKTTCAAFLNQFHPFLFVKWYNHDHHHSGLKFLTPYQRRSGLSDKILAKRKEVYEAAKTEHPERWNGRLTRDWSLPDTVYLNPEKISEEAETAVEETAVS